MCIFVILSSFEAYCQEVKYTISGTINSSQGEPLWWELQLRSVMVVQVL